MVCKVLTTAPGSLLQDQVNCFYHGQVLEHPEWKVAMDSCQGLRYIIAMESIILTYPHKDDIYIVIVLY